MKGDKKEPGITLRKYGIKITETDYRGFIALILSIGFIALLAKGDLQAASILGPLTGMAVGWYFRGKEKNEA